MSVECFFIVPAMRTRRSLRRYSHAPCVAGKYSYHNADGPLLDVVPDEITDRHWTARALDDWPHDDPRWPTKCDHCTYHFVGADFWQVFHDPVYLDSVTGEEHSLRDRRPGMMWDAFWMGPHYQGPDGRCLVVVCPDGSEWMIDGPASNCTEPADRGPHGQAHRCWTRSGAPPRITVGKQFGRTCSAGGGSIAVPGYHGFLQDGRFT